MIFRPASEEEFEAVKKKYQDVAEHTPEIRRYARWEYGKHPTDEGIRRYIDNGEMYLLMNGDEIAGMTAVVMYQERDYEAVQWAEMLDNDQVATLHLLAVCPDYQGKSLGGKILDEVVRLARKSGRRAIRLDTLKTNLPAQHMYEKAGFTERRTASPAFAYKEESWDRCRMVIERFWFYQLGIYGGERVDEFEQDDSQSRLSDRNDDSISVCGISDHRFFHGQLLCLPDPADRVYHDDGRSSSRVRR